MRIKKTSQYLEGGASISNVYGTSTSNGYSQNFLNRFNNLIKINDGTMGDSSVESFTIEYKKVYLYINTHIYQRSIVLITILNGSTYNADVIFKSSNSATPTISISGTTLTITNQNQTRAELYQLTGQICG